MAESEPELPGVRIYRAVKLINIFRSSFLKNQIRNRSKHKDRKIEGPPLPVGVLRASLRGDSRC